jgi:hypothetical protein
VLGSRGRDYVWAELPDGRTCHLPLRWTDQVPRAAHCCVNGAPVRLDVQALQSLARWVGDRVQKLDLGDRDDHKGRDGIDDSMRRRDAAVAMVGKARASRSDRSRRRRNGVR